MFFQQFSQHGVFSLELGLELFDFLIASIDRRSFWILERSHSVFEEHLLPIVEDGGLELVLLAQLRDRDLVDQMPFEDRDFLGRGVVLSRLAHVGAPLFTVMLTGNKPPSNSERCRTEENAVRVAWAVLTNG